MAVTTENLLKSDIKSGNISRVYLFYGRDFYSVGLYLKALVNKLADKDSRALNLHEFDGKELNISQLADACEGLPMFAQYNVCTVGNINAANKGEFSKEKYDVLISLIKDLPETTVLIIYYNAIDICGGKKNPEPAYKRLIDNVTKYGTVCAFPIKTDSENAKIICSLAKKKKCSIGLNEAMLLARRCSGDMLMINCELDKLAAYADGETVTAEMIDELCSSEDDSRINQLTDAISLQKKESALKIYKELIDMRYEPIVLLYSIMNSFTDRYRAKTAIDCGKNAADVKNDFDYGKRGFVVDQAFRSAGRISAERLNFCIELLIECERSFKTRPAPLRYAAIEEAIIKMAGGVTPL